MKTQNATHADVLQNLSGKFEATFTSDGVSGAARFPYRAQKIQHALIRVPGILDFDTESGTIARDPTITSDYRGIRLTLKSDIASGSYVFPEDDVISNITYSELEKSGTGFYTNNYRPTHAELKLEVSEDGRRYSGTLKFDVLINTEILKINSSFEVILHFKDSAAEQPRQPTSKEGASIETLHNITGTFNATFPVSESPGETSYARAPYHSSNLSYDTLFLIEDINFRSHAGNISQIAHVTTDRREFQIHLKQGITSGTYRYTDPGSPITQLQYNEMRYVNDRYISWSLEIIDATLELEVIEQRRYIGKRLSITARTTTGELLYIIADFDIYLSRD